MPEATRSLDSVCRRALLGYPAGATAIPDDLLEDLGRDLSTGRLVLFTGAGFSVGALDHDGRPLPSTAELRDLLWPLVFQELEPDGSELADLYECALRCAHEETGELLRRRLQVDERSLPEVYRTWYSMPWFRSYTLNVDDLDDAVQRRFDLPVVVRPVSALGDELPARSRELLSIHLNGSVAGFPRITFSHQQYGERTALPDPWYQHLALDLGRHPVLFVGTQLAEPPLWQQVALRVNGDNGAERPRSYIVTQHLPLARQRILSDLNVGWIPMAHEQFAEQVLEKLEDAAAEGLHALGASSR